MPSPASEEAKYGYVDYSCVSPFERFVRELTVTLKALMTAPAEPETDADSSGQPCASSKTVSFKQTAYELRLVQGQGSILCSSHKQEVPTSGRLQRWLGVHTFATLAPVQSTRSVLQWSKLAVSESTTAALLSALSLAGVECQCPFPLLVAQGALDEACFRGRLACGGELDISVQRSPGQPPPALRYLSGIVNSFEDKLRVQYQQFTKDFCDEHIMVFVACSMTFMQEISAMWETNDELEVSRVALNCRWRDCEHDEQLSFGTFWGPQLDPLARVRLMASWPFFPRGTFVENAVYSDLDPLQAPNWALTLNWVRDGHWLDAPLSGAVRRLVDLRDLSPIPTSTIDRKEQQQRKRKQAELSESKEDSVFLAVRAAEMFKSGLEEAAQAVLHGESLTLEEVTQLVIEPAFAKQKGKEATEAEQGEDEEQFPLPAPDHVTDPSKLPAPFGSLLSRLVLKLLAVHIDMQKLTPHTLELLWQAFTARVRSCYEAGLPLPFVEDVDSPDFHACLVHQKLQLLQICIAANDSTALGPPADPSTSTQGQEVKTMEEEAVTAAAFEEAAGWGDLDVDLEGSDSSGEEDEFFDVPAAVPETATLQALGRKAWHEEQLYLLQHPTTEKLYVPVTQRQMVRTLDMFEEHQKLLEQLGTQPEASAQRRKLQMGGLLSDMAAFKYANNHAAFADFIRWYSPHDWLPEQKQLTTRMAAPDCEWKLAWESTEPCRADQQELMFDPSTEGEKALAWLEALEPWTFADDLCQIAATHAVCIFLRTEGSAAQVPVVSSLLQRATHGCKNWAVKGVTHEVCDVLANAELLCSRATSLLYCFPGSHALVDSLLSRKAGKLTTKQERASVTTLFSTDDHDPDSDSQAPGLDGEEERKYSLPTPELREYTVLSTLPQASQPEQTAVVPAFYNRVYASISSSEFRYASCWQPYQP